MQIQSSILAGIFALLPLATSACKQPTSSEFGSANQSQGPLPTEHRLRDEDEKRSQSDRLRWIEEMHVAPPRVDWREVEAANQARELARRNRLSRDRQTVASAPPNPWGEVGSKNQAGHVRCAAIGPERNGMRWLYCGSAHGGLWRIPLGGGDWEPLSDNLYGGIDDVLALAPANANAPDVLFVRKGEALYRSPDNGATWTTPTGLDSLDDVHQIGLLPDAGQTLLVLGRRPGTGNYRLTLWASTDRGASFSQRWFSTPSWKARLWFPTVGAGAGSTIYLLYQGRILRSLDAGFQFTEVGIVDANASEGILSGSDAGAPTLYSAIKSAGSWKLYRSDNAGVTSSFVHNFGDYWGPFSAYPHNPQAVIYGGLEGWRSLDGGQSFQRINTWGSYYSNPGIRLHADLRGIHVFADPRTDLLTDVCYVSTDGGIYESQDYGLTVRNLSLDGLGVGQFYSTHTSVNNSDLIAGGTQDQGYQRGFRLPYTEDGPSTPFDQLISGDYGHLSSSNGSHNLLYSTYPGFVLIQDGEQNPALRFADFPSTNHLWLPPVVADPYDSTRFFFLGRHLYRYTRVNTSTWTSAQYSSQDFAAFGGAYLSALAFAPSQPERAYAMVSNGAILISNDHGLNWAQAPGPGPGSHYFYGNTIAIHPSNAAEVFVGGSGYGGSGVRRSLDGGQSWEVEVDGLPLTMIYDLCFAPDGSGDVYAATEIGAYRWLRSTEQWENIMDVYAPNTTYWSVEAVDASDVVRFGTYGRGIWDFQLHPPTSGSWTRYGEGLGGANLLDLDSATVPNIGTPQVLVMSGAVAHASGWVQVGIERAHFPFAGGYLLVSINPQLFGQSARLPFLADSAGEAQVPFDLPNDSAWIGRRFTYQALAHDPFMPQGLALSNGLEMTIGY